MDTPRQRHLRAAHRAYHQAKAAMEFMVLNCREAKIEPSTVDVILVAMTQLSEVDLQVVTEYGHESLADQSIKEKT